jgi:hypothetical protein
MAGRFGPIKIYCDAPPDPVVQKCERLGFESPLDVRWCRLSHFLNENGEPRGALGLPPWKWFFARSRRKERTCTCGRTLPVLAEYTFPFAWGEIGTYFLGQCHRCGTMFWEEG